MKSVAITGYKGSGKDTLADSLSGTHTKMAFADPLRQVCAIVFGLTMKEMTDRELKEKPLDRWPYMSPREILQKVGTECFRDHFPGVWIENMKRRVADNDGPVVIPDMRFMDEAEAAEDLGMLTVKVTRPSLGESTDKHSSEAFIKILDVDLEIVNDFPDAETFTEQAQAEVIYNAS